MLEWRVAVGSIDNTTTLPGFGSITLWLDLVGSGDVYEARPDPNVLLRLQDVDGVAFANDLLPTTPPPLAAFEAAAVAQLDPGTQQPLLVIGLETLDLHPAPIPLLPGWATGVGLGAVLAVGHRLRRSSKRACAPPNG